VTPYVRALLFATIGVFFLQATLGRGFTAALGFYPPALLFRPWTMVTYMFLHAPGLMHIGFNMIALFFFGPRVEERLGSRSFLILYFVSGITGALLSFIGPPALIIGASGAVFGVMLAFAWFWPDAPIMIWGIIPVPARILVIITTVLSLYSGLGGTGRGIAHFAHLGGYLGAFLYLKWLQRGRQEFRKRATAAPKARELRFTTRPKVDLAKVHEVNREEVNRILDKISAHGMSSLSADEQQFLSNFSAPDDRAPPVS
jgi:membrane associated rhomboid family serine protease